MNNNHKIYVHKNDLPNDVELVGSISLDTEAMGLKNFRDRLCTVQLTDEERKIIHIVQFEKGKYDAPNLKKFLEDKNRVKIFHYARFDMAIVKHYLQINIAPVFCTKIASKLVRTYTDRHGLKDLCNEMVGVQLSKIQQSSDWGADILSKEQKDYAASDVLYLHKIREELIYMLERENRTILADKCFKFLATRVELDLLGWDDLDIFAHHSKPDFKG